MWSNVPKNVKTQSGDSSWLLMSQFLRLCSKKFQRDVRTLPYPNPYYDIRKWTVFYLPKTRNLRKINWVFPCMAMYMNGHNDLESHIFRYFTEFVSKSGYDPKNFREVSVENLPVVEEIVHRNTFIYHFDIQEGENLGELARRSLVRFDKTVKLLRFNNHIIHTNDIDSLFKCFRCPSCDTFFKISDFLNKHLLRCKDRAKHS